MDNFFEILFHSTKCYTEVFMKYIKEIMLEYKNKSKSNYIKFENS